MQRTPVRKQADNTADSVPRDRLHAACRLAAATTASQRGSVARQVALVQEHLLGNEIAEHAFVGPAVSA
ncbi:hypothetical protein JWJ90_15460 [Desulfobulbus rhabdoformis]|uniref:hypothetical protein n=1 Tax=Desulfobulbus rhabdoformis TaxID=34032 RepID=UPI00196376D5|nr:hypothetical protein [Desulfobulbus rhabdoformis]MBM9615666.1 hypothetical protein [Desulfobulbus rhabdoformis]